MGELAVNFADRPLQVLVAPRRAEAVERAEHAGQAGRYEEMLDHMEAVAKLPTELTPRERYLFLASAKGLVNRYRRELRITPQPVTVDSGAAKEHPPIAEVRLFNTCWRFIELMKHQGNIATSAEGKVFYLKGVADYYRYISVYSHGELMNNSIAAAHAYYQRASTQVASLDPPIQLLRVVLGMNFSVFLHDILGDKAEALKLARDALSLTSSLPAGADASNQAAEYEQALRENIQDWSAEDKNSSLVADAHDARKPEGSSDTIIDSTTAERHVELLLAEHFPVACTSLLAELRPASRRPSTTSACTETPTDELATKDAARSAPNAAAAPAPDASATDNGATERPKVPPLTLRELRKRGTNSTLPRLSARGPSRPLAPRPPATPSSLRGGSSGAITRALRTPRTAR